ncbi:hypothetical protein KCP77_17395 [Salmonella enterica subsp. enterica]|nr:hypothetical protein KCP77_17395 [Salmonella enterica subsp. enterica]
MARNAFHQRGYQARHAGRSKEMCPYQTLNQRSYWLGGYDSHGGQGR